MHGSVMSNSWRRKAPRLLDSLKRKSRRSRREFNPGWANSRTAKTVNRVRLGRKASKVASAIKAP